MNINVDLIMQLLKELEHAPPDLIPFKVQLIRLEISQLTQRKEN